MFSQAIVDRSVRHESLQVVARNSGTPHLPTRLPDVCPQVEYVALLVKHSHHRFYNLQIVIRVKLNPHISRKIMLINATTPAAGESCSRFLNYPFDYVLKSVYIVVILYTPLLFLFTFNYLMCVLIKILKGSK